MGDDFDYAPLLALGGGAICAWLGVWPVAFLCWGFAVVQLFIFRKQHEAHEHALQTKDLGPARDTLQLGLIVALVFVVIFLLMAAGGMAGEMP